MINKCILWQKSCQGYPQYILANRRHELSKDMASNPPPPSKTRGDGDIYIESPCNSIAWRSVSPEEGPRFTTVTRTLQLQPLRIRFLFSTHAGITTSLASQRV